MLQDGTVPKQTRSEAATQAGLSERQRKTAERIQARAIRRAGELYKQIGNEEGGRPNKNHDGTDMVLTRTEAAREAGLNSFPAASRAFELSMCGKFSTLAPGWSPLRTCIRPLACRS